jgi:hypothetical protein
MSHAIWMAGHAGQAKDFRPKPSGYADMQAGLDVQHQGIGRRLEADHRLGAGYDLRADRRGA